MEKDFLKEFTMDQRIELVGIVFDDAKNNFGTYQENNKNYLTSEDCKNYVLDHPEDATLESAIESRVKKLISVIAPSSPSPQGV